MRNEGNKGYIMALLTTTVLISNQVFNAPLEVNGSTNSYNASINVTDNFILENGFNNSRKTKLISALEPYELPDKDPIREMPKVEEEMEDEEKRKTPKELEEERQKEEELKKKEEELKRKEEELKRKEEEQREREKEALRKEQELINKERQKQIKEKEEKDRIKQKKIEEVDEKDKTTEEDIFDMEDYGWTLDIQDESNEERMETNEESENGLQIETKRKPSKKINKTTTNGTGMKVLDRGKLELGFKLSDPIEVTYIRKDKLSPIFKEESGARKQYLTKSELANIIYTNSYLPAKYVGSPYRDLYDTDMEIQATLVTQNGIMLPNSYLEFGTYDLVTWGDLKRATRKIDRLKRYHKGDIFYSPFNKVNHLVYMNSNQNKVPTKTNIINVMQRILFEGRDFKLELKNYKSEEIENVGK